ncbi:MAG TPA: hypothetical protein VKU87_06450, partial [Thermomicrobiaceae bacterium]|nr:hypothetical protein [Thermomicrobiaceae bacterium]
PVVFDDTVRYLHRAMFSLGIAPVRANAQGAASGGGATSSAGGSHSHTVSGQSASSGGGGTSSVDGSHSHSISVVSTGSTAPEHTHVVGTAKSTGAYVAHNYQQQIQYESDKGLYGIMSLRDTPDSTDTHLTSWASTGTAHSHTVSGQTATSGGSHSHTISAHTHSITGTTSSADGTHSHSVPPHTHDLVYGIYEGPNPNSPYCHVLINGVDVTTQLGGPWNGGTTVDVTPWLVDDQGRVLRTDMTIEVKVSQLCDLTLTLRSLVSASSVVPV